MRLSELSEDFKQYTLTTSKGSEYIVSGTTRLNILKSKNNFIELGNGNTINKAFIVEFKLNIEATRDFVEKNKNSLIKI